MPADAKSQKKKKGDAAAALKNPRMVRVVELATAAERMRKKLEEARARKARRRTWAQNSMRDLGLPEEGAIGPVLIVPGGRAIGIDAGRLDLRITGPGQNRASQRVDRDLEILYPAQRLIIDQDRLCELCDAVRVEVLQENVVSTGGVVPGHPAATVSIGSRVGHGGGGSTTGNQHVHRRIIGPLS